MTLPTVKDARLQLDQRVATLTLARGGDFAGDVAGVATRYRRGIDAAEAKALGITLEVVEPDALLARAQAMAARFAAQPPKALRLTKRLTKMAQRMELKDFLDLCATFQGMCHNEPEHLAAVNRMLGKS